MESWCYSIEFLLNLSVLIDVILEMNNVNARTYKYALLAIGCVSCYIGIYNVLIASVEDGVPFWRFSWWCIEPDKTDLKDSDISTEEHWNKVMNARGFSILWFSPKIENDNTKFEDDATMAISLNHGN